MAQLKILVVDDEPGIRSGVARILGNFHVTYPFMDEDYTFNILEAATGEEGIEIIEREMPDILLLDNSVGDNCRCVRRDNGRPQHQGRRQC